MRAVFFDAGGTLLHIDYARVSEVIRGVLGRAPAPESFVAAEYAGRAAVERLMATGPANSDDSRWAVHFQAMLAAAGVGPEEFARVGPAIRDEHRRQHLWTTTRAGTAEALSALRGAGYLVAVISNADGTVERLLDQAGLRAHLEFVVDSGIIGVEKPDPRIFEIALQRGGVRAEESYYVGDIYPVDVVGSRAVGMEPILLDPLGRYGDRDCRTAPDVPALCHELVSALEAA